MRAAGPLDFLAIDAALGRYRESIGGGPEFDAWQASFWTRFGASVPLAYLDGDRVALVEGSSSHRIVLHADADCLPALVSTLRADPEVRAISLSDAGGLEGFRPVERWEHRFDLAFTPERPYEPREAFEVRPWDAAGVGAAAALLTKVSSATLDGLYLTWPEAPTPETCRRVLADFIAGSHGPFSPETSLQAWRGSDLAGLTLMSLPGADEALLFEIAVRFRYRGTGLARHLLDRFKLELRGRGFRTVRFLACGHNAAVSALFRPEEVESRSLDRGFVWMRG